MTARRIATVALTVTLLALPSGVALAAPADLDPGFGQNGRLTLDDGEVARALALQPDGRILVAGDAPLSAPADHDGVVYRLNPSGTLDQTFALGGARRLDEIGSGAQALALQPDGKVLAAGYGSSNAIVYRLHADGSPDQTFGQFGAAAIDSGGTERVFALAFQPDGKILVAGGTYTPDNGDFDPVVYRLKPDGTPDGDFGTGGTFRIVGAGSETARALALQPDGKVLVAGGTIADDSTDAVVYRLKANGTLDDDFGRFRIDEGAADFAQALVRQPDGRILVAGYTSRPDQTADAFAYRLRGDGTLDPGFGQGGSVRIDDGPANGGVAAALQADGRIVVAGFTTAGGNTDAAVYRLNNDGSPDVGFDADGAVRIDGGGAEIAVALAVQQDGRIVVAGATVSGLTQKAVVYRLQGGDPVPSSPASPVSRPGAPVLDRLRISPSTFRATVRGPSALTARRRRGALVSFTLDRAATVRFAVARAHSGRRVDGRCVKPRRSNGRGRRCTRYRLLRGDFTRRGVAGANRFRLTGRMNARRLRPARYRLIATPVAEGQRGDTKRAAFRIRP